MVVGYSLLEGVGSALMIPPVYILITVACADVKTRANGRSTWGGSRRGPRCPLIVVVMTPTNRQRAAPDIHIVGDGDTRGYTAKRTTLNKRPARDGVDLVLLDGNR